MKKYLVIGNPISHSLSPRVHNHWIKINNLAAVYEKKKVKENDLEKLIYEIKNDNLSGLNVTVPFKRSIISYLDDLTQSALRTQSVNTIFKKEKKIVGDNTDIGGFEASFKDIKYETKNKKAFILGAGGVVPSIILALKNLGVSQIAISNRTQENLSKVEKLFPDIKIIEWGEIVEFDIIINATSVGLKKNDKISLDLSSISGSKLFYDVIYNPNMTNFLLEAKKNGHKTENGKKMFIYQAQLAFKIWHNITPQVNQEIFKLLDR